LPLPVDDDDDDDDDVDVDDDDGMNDWINSTEATPPKKADTRRRLEEFLFFRCANEYRC
jgi:hypothetical protein